MRLLKPSWLHHDGNPIFSIDIHPDDTRVVTGGQGNDSVGRVVIWNMSPILSKKEDHAVPKLLCQLDHHNACVNCVRWSHTGKYLCSGGDDRVIIVWKLVSKYSGTLNTSAVQNSAFGKTNLEQWKPSSMLRSHTGDVLDLAWSPDDKYLASASVDNTVIVWDGQNFPQIITTIKGHQSLVKGVTWDPVGKYLASQSDDKTLKIWRVSDWELECCVQDPFLECGGTTHVLRLDWSPDGLYLVSAHAMNGGGPTAQIVERAEWKTDKDFVGHRKAVVCVKFNGNIMQSESSRMKHCFVALGSRDRSVSVWSTSLKRPLVVIRDLFTNSVMDLSWSSCGTVMMACSWDGTVAVAKFSGKEIGKALSQEETAKFYQKHYGKSVVTTENCDIIQNLEVFLAKSNTVQNSEDTKKNQPELLPPPPPQQPLIKGPTDKQIETRTADGRRRITPKFLLPPTGGEETNPTKSEQAVFMQGKGKEDVVSNNQTTAQDWRKSMVSSIENVKGFSETVPGGSGVSINNNNSQGRSSGGSDVTENCVNEGKCEKEEENGVETMEVDVNDVRKSPPKLVNGNGPHGSSESGDDNSKKNAVFESSSVVEKKDKLVNGEASSGPSPQVSENDKNQNEDVSINLTNGVVHSDNESKLATRVKEKSPPVLISEVAGRENEEGASLKAVPSSKKDASPAPVPSTTPTTAGAGGAQPIAFRKKKLQSSEDTPKAGKKVKLSAPASGNAGESEGPPKLAQQTISPHVGITGTSLVLPPQRTFTGSSPTKAEKSHRLPPMKIETVLNVQVDIRVDCSYSLEVTNHHKRPDGMCHQLVCRHSASSLNALEWTLCTDAPICGLTGDMFRIVVLCENSTAHVMDIKGRYAFPPMMLSSHPSKCLQSGPFLVIVTTKAVLHVWNIHLKKVVLKSESLLPLMNQNDTDKDRVLDIARIQVAAGGLPIIVLNSGKTFMYSLELTTWLLISDPRGLVSSPLASSPYDQSLSSRTMLFGSDGRFRSKPEPAIISHIKLKLATSTEMRNVEGIKQWLIALAKSLATHGLEKELHQLCGDLLGPTHSSAKCSTKWSPTILGLVDKRKVLRQVLSLLLEDLKFQDFYSEYDELLKDVESQLEGEQQPGTNLTNPNTSTNMNS